jgi:hypothetical protein
MDGLSKSGVTGSLDGTTTPKNGKTRRVDMSAQLTQGLRELLTARKAETLRKGWKHMPDWVFSNEGRKAVGR